MVARIELCPNPKCQHEVVAGHSASLTELGALTRRGKPFFTVHCHNCDMSGPIEQSRTAAIKGWNALWGAGKSGKEELADAATRLYNDWLNLQGDGYLGQSKIGERFRKALAAYRLRKV